MKNRFYNLIYDFDKYKKRVEPITLKESKKLSSVITIDNYSINKEITKSEIFERNFYNDNIRGNLSFQKNNPYSFSFFASFDFTDINNYGKANIGYSFQDNEDNKGFLNSNILNSNGYYNITSNMCSDNRISIFSFYDNSKIKLLSQIAPNDNIISYNEEELKDFLGIYPDYQFELKFQNQDEEFNLLINLLKHGTSYVETLIDNNYKKTPKTRLKLKK